MVTEAIKNAKSYSAPDPPTRPSRPVHENHIRHTLCFTSSQTLSKTLQGLQNGDPPQAGHGRRSTSTETLDYHANVLPTHLRMNLAAYMFAVRLCTLPPSHSLQKIVERCKRIPRFHRSPIHHLMSTFEDLHGEWETIKAGRVNVLRSKALEFIVADSKKSAEQDVAKFPKGDHHIYSDGSGFKAKIGAAAWMQPLESAPNGEVQVYNASFTWVLILITPSTPRLTKAAIILDSQAAILVLQSGKTKSGKYLVEEFHNQVRKLQATRKTLRIRVQWVPGHVGINGNETQTQPRRKRRWVLPLPGSKAATIAAFSKQTKHVWADLWTNSPKGRFTKCIDNAPPSAKLRDPECANTATVSHFLLTCRRYTTERQALRHRTNIANLQLRHLISTNSKHIYATISFVNKTGRLPEYFKSNEDRPPP
ncbi:uncharacterized protein ARMOST_04832 [Armillaria ostoyae]|uniref:Uncharacterized protein n=1 Tax=Armillaria ostoyae TaxID=47428 RepID=A0A284QYG7_ARMOS|nr:uncharacterized protein ARMOST_04832 [Armillaria ostoyae]